MNNNISVLEHKHITKYDLESNGVEDGFIKGLEDFLQMNWEFRKMLFSDKSISNKQQFLDFNVRDGFRTKNYVGIVSFNGVKINIFPKVFNGFDSITVDSSNQKSLFIRSLIQWIKYSEKVYFPFVKDFSDLSDQMDMIELFIEIYIRYVRELLSKNPYHQYETFSKDIGLIKGKMNINDYASKKIPKGQFEKFNCRFSEYVFDNSINRIIKTTLIMILKITDYKKQIRDIKNILSVMTDVANIHKTPYDCDQALRSCTNDKYRVILNLSKLFLLNGGNFHDTGPNDSFCFLFPSEMLFESFVVGFIKDVFSEDLNVRYQTSDNYLAEVVIDGELRGEAFLLREDIIIESDDYVYVIDTKYKKINRLDTLANGLNIGVNENDLKQLLVYALKRDAKKLALIYPLSIDEETTDRSVIYNIRVLEDGINRVFPIEVIKIPFLFDEDIELTKSKLSKLLSRIVC